MRASQLMQEWADDLAPVVGRTAEDIRRNGLNAGDFPSDYALHIELKDKSYMFFQYAICAVNRPREEIAVFTEHCGYHVFSSCGATIMRLRGERIFTDLQD